MKSSSFPVSKKESLDEDLNYFYQNDSSSEEEEYNKFINVQKDLLSKELISGQLNKEDICLSDKLIDLEKMKPTIEDGFNTKIPIGSGNKIQQSDSDELLNTSKSSKFSKQNRSSHLSDNLKNKKFWWRIIRPWKWKKSKKNKVQKNSPSSFRSSNTGDRPLLTVNQQSQLLAQVVSSTSNNDFNMIIRDPQKPLTSELFLKTSHQLKNNDKGSTIYKESSNPQLNDSQNLVHESSSTMIKDQFPKSASTSQLQYQNVKESKIQSPLKITTTACYTNSQYETEFPVNSNSISIDNFASIPLAQTETSLNNSIKSNISEEKQVDNSNYTDTSFSNYTQTHSSQSNSLQLSENKENLNTETFSESVWQPVLSTTNPVLSTARTLAESSTVTDSDDISIQASEPNLHAKPKKPALKKPGQPSRKVIPKRTSSRRKESQRRAQRAAIVQRRKTLESKNTKFCTDENDLPTRLTDDSDSDPDIQYRDDLHEISPKLQDRNRINGTSTKSTNPLIASKIVPVKSIRRSADGNNESDEDVSLTNGLAMKIQRKDTLARQLDTSKVSDDIPNQTSSERRRLMHKVSLKLERKLSERPLAQELEQRNILKVQGADSLAKKNMDETRKMLLRKLSFRPTVEELKYKQIIKFNDYVEVMEAEMYNRKGDKPWTRLTQSEKALIRKELNDYKLTEMAVHEDSRVYTRFHRP
ncbi:RPEL repeat-containing protein [Strongyloides ratti]|uniref:RPEL repeat-containing protein n=1 Tax=Strongyloides ratti TaxID=34506 RepID=A0A090LE06_STRRB|nr:RPEL repeat-containing protein [Strongyloides ratti]CEF65700.1 RPEL repeat-containing protein [Strongyloides ratti]